MRERTRVRVFFAAGGVFFLLYCYAALGLPASGSFHGPYGEFVARMAVYERHATDTVNTINYDYRAFDTLGEEFILFTAVLGVMLLLRREEGSVKTPGTVADRAPLSRTVRSVTLPAAAISAVYGLYIGLHGNLTPGGGFQAGVILATAPLLVYLSENTTAFARIASHRFMEVLEAVGAGGYAVIGAVPLFLSVPFLTNFLPLGQTGQVFSSGTVALISATVGVEVTAAFVLVLCTYLQEIIQGGSPDA